MSLDIIEDILDDLRQGKMVILMDDEDRENEGDLLMAAECVTPDDINFMARFGRGLICLTLTEDHCRKLDLPLMVNNNRTPYATNFTVSIEAAEGVTTGISAADRAKTVQVAVNEDVQAADIITPGHVFPLMAQKGGVLSRAGHTEAGVDLAALAGLRPASVICEILKDDGTMARMPDLLEFAKMHKLRIGTIEDLIRYRRQYDSLLRKEGETHFESRYGRFKAVVYRDTLSDREHLALVRGNVDADNPPVVRVQVHNGLYDLLGDLQQDSGWTINKAMERMADDENAVLVILNNEESKNGLLESLQGSLLENVEKKQKNTEDKNTAADPETLRTFGIGSQILSDLGVKKMRVISGSPLIMHSLAGFDLEVVEFITQ
ncbi:MAG: bifunctional 3,4-dihydroxy-2-butanone-4-phosphate synthase/GTP cyclohydrolase II [Pseudomonadota bacterium]|nr:bifunctional 3,4-dihydroxy-2-butanone-4-phosphate synthase/GTP cyclohydrolase II [Pseudomonadota bacterium]